MFLLCLHLFFISGVISPLICSSILGTYWPGEFLSVSYHFAFSYCSWDSQGKNTEVVCHCLPQWTTFFSEHPSKFPMHAVPHSVSANLKQATANPHLHWRLLNTHRQVSVSLFRGHCSFLLGSGAQKVLFVSLKSLFPQSCVKFCNQIPRPSKVKFPGGSQSFCQIPRLGSLLWVLELS